MQSLQGGVFVDFFVGMFSRGGILEMKIKDMSALPSSSSYSAWCGAAFSQATQRATLVNLTKVSIVRCASCMVRL